MRKYEKGYVKKIKVSIIVIILIFSSIIIIQSDSLDVLFQDASASEGVLTQFANGNDSINVLFSQQCTQYVLLEVSKTYSANNTSMTIEGLSSNSSIIKRIDTWSAESISTKFNISIPNPYIRLNKSSSFGFINSTQISFPGLIQSVSADVNISGNQSNAYYTLYVSDNEFISSKNITNCSQYFNIESYNLWYNLSVYSLSENYTIDSIEFNISLFDFPTDIEIGIMSKSDIFNNEGRFNYTDNCTDFADSLNSYLNEHKNESPENDLLVPLQISSKTIGSIFISNLSIPWTTIDLTITDISIEGTDPYSQGDNIIISIDVTNYNQTASPFLVNAYIDSVSEENIIGGTTGNSNGNDQIQLNISWNTININGSHELICYIDPLNSLYEINEGNNQISYGYISIEPRDPNDMSLSYDLECTDFHPSSSSIHSGDVINMSIQCANNGWSNSNSNTIRILRNDTVIYDDDISLLSFSSSDYYYQWNSSGYCGTAVFSFQMDPLSNISEYNEDNNNEYFSIFIMSPRTNELLFRDDYNISNWTQFDNSSILLNNPPASGDKYWKTCENHTGYSNISIPSINFSWPNQTSYHYLTFSSNHSFNMGTNIGKIILCTTYEQKIIMNTTGISGGENDSIWIDISLNLSEYVNISNSSYFNCSILFSCFLNGSDTNYWYIDNISIINMSYFGDIEDGSEFFGRNWSITNWEYITAIGHTGIHWMKIIEDERECWWNGNESTSLYMNNLDNLFISPAILLPNNGNITTFKVEFTLKYSLSDMDFVEFFICNSTLSNGTSFDVYSGEQTEWTTMEYDISLFNGQPIFLCFRIVSNGGGNDTGFFLDPIDIWYLNYGIFPIGIHRIEAIKSRIHHRSYNKYTIDEGELSHDSGLTEDHPWEFYSSAIINDENTLFINKVYQYSILESNQNFLYTTLHVSIPKPSYAAMDTYTITCELYDENLNHTLDLKTIDDSGNRVNTFSETNSEIIDEHKNYYVTFFTETRQSMELHDYAKPWGYLKWTVDYQRDEYLRIGDREPFEYRLLGQLWDDEMVYYIPIEVIELGPVSLLEETMGDCSLSVVSNPEFEINEYLGYGPDGVTTKVGFPGTTYRINYRLITKSGYADDEKQTFGFRITHDWDIKQHGNWGDWIDVGQYAKRYDFKDTYELQQHDSTKRIWYKDDNIITGLPRITLYDREKRVTMKFEGKIWDEDGDVILEWTEISTHVIFFKVSIVPYHQQRDSFDTQDPNTPPMHTK